MKHILAWIILSVVSLLLISLLGLIIYTCWPILVIPVIFFSVYWATETLSDN